MKSLREVVFILALAASLWGFGSFSYALAENNPSKIKIEKSEIQLTSVPATQRLQQVVLQSPEQEHGMIFRGVDSETTWNFGVRRDEVVQSATLELDLTFSPSLLDNLSHLKILLNDQIIRAIKIDKNELGQNKKLKIDISPLLFVEYNKLQIQFIGHYTEQCESPTHSSLWARIGPDSKLQMQLQKIRLHNDLSVLPLPFFDPRDNSRVQANFVLPADPDLALVHAAGLVAGWIGSKAAYRNTDFKTYINELADKNAIVFMTNTQRPEFLAHAPVVERPTIEIQDHPLNSAHKLLVLQGKDAQQLQEAAQALAHGNFLFSGEKFVVQTISLPEKRKPYDAPRWISTERPVRFAELQSDPVNLEVKGVALNRAIRSHMDVPPDLFSWNRENFLLDLIYTYTPNKVSDHGLVTVLLNDNFIRSFPLKNIDSSDSSITSFFSRTGNFQVQEKMHVPAEFLSFSNSLAVTVQIPSQSVGQCASTMPVEVRGAISPESTIDLSKIPHFIEMPNLRAFAKGGFPFSKFADLQETGFVFATRLNVPVITTFLNVVGMVSASTGYPASRFTLAAELDEKLLKNKELLIISDGSESHVLDVWKEHIGIALDVQRHSFVFPSNKENYLQRLNELSRGLVIEGAGQGQHAMGAIVGFQSPWDHSRSAIALLGNTDEALIQLNEFLGNPQNTEKIRGDLVIIAQNQSHSFDIKNKYYVGELPFFKHIWYRLHEHPLLVAILGTLVGLAFAFVTFASLRIMARRRLENVD